MVILNQQEKIKKQTSKKTRLDQVHNSHNQANNHRTISPQPARATSDAHLLVRHLVSRIVIAQRPLRDRPVPAVLLETLAAHLRDLRARPVQRARQDRAADAGGPAVVAQRAVGLRGGVVAVEDDGVALGDVVGRVEGADVGVVDVGRVGEVDDQRRDVGGVGEVAGVAAEEGRAGVQPKVGEGGYAGNAGEGGVVLDGVEGAPVGGFEGCAIGPSGTRVGSRPCIVCISGGVDGEDYVDGALRLDERVEGNVLEVLVELLVSEF